MARGILWRDSRVPNHRPPSPRKRPLSTLRASSPRPVTPWFTPWFTPLVHRVRQPCIIGLFISSLPATVPFPRSLQRLTPEFPMTSHPFVIVCKQYHATLDARF